MNNLFNELERLLDVITFDHFNKISILQARSCFPLLWKYGRGCQGGVNVNYFDISNNNFRNHDQFVFFPSDNEYVFVLPRALTAAAGCSAIFKMIWDRGKQVSQDFASKIIGKVIEKSILISCKKHNLHVWENLSYYADGKRLEFDFAVREGQEIILFETKAKSLTSKARTVNVMAFVSDYTKSFLSMLRQVVRHELNIKRGRTPLTEIGEDLHVLRITKITVSPLCYGPVSDHVLVGSFFNSMSNAILCSATGNIKDDIAAEEFNEKMNLIKEDIGELWKMDNQINFHNYFIDIFWLDLGGLLYLLYRGNSVADSLSPLKSITFSTQDFWTEAACAETMGLTNEKWRPFQVDNPSKISE